jgi:hypothetical protein
MTAQEESLKQTLIKMRQATSPKEYGEAIAEHFKKFTTPAIVSVKNYEFDVLNAPLLKKLGDLDNSIIAH